MTTRVVVLIMGGGRGTRLFPLTATRSKPAVPVGGKYRLIDIPVSNCVNSDIRQIFVLTQFNSESLNRHVSQTYRFDRFSRGMISILAAEQTPDHTDWFQGTADAVRKSLRHIADLYPELVLILSGDQLYRMDFRAFIYHHMEKRADISVATKPVTADEAPALGIMRTDRNGWITEFREKPPRGELQGLESQQERLPEGRRFLGNMGIYLFDAGVLLDVLEQRGEDTDFGKEVLPAAISTHRVSSSMFDGYWTDIGTIGSFFEANIEMASDRPQFDLYGNLSPLYTRARALPGARVDGSRIDSSIICDASEIRGATIRSSVVGIRSHIGPGVRMERTVFMGADYWEGGFRDPAMHNPELPPLGLGQDCLVRNAIIDKNARIGPGCALTNDKGIMTFDGPGYHIRDGIIVIPKNAVIPPGSVI
ncbi:glucose-1-phosphate adenylyltransferase [Candidatus Fermentibacterales bacterium]|nr:glucose-1-phosphate adenylyltransferase [Candidatus Fermentibacterales bacterium]